MDFAIYIVKYFAAPATVIGAVAWLAKEIALQIIKTQSALSVEKSRYEIQQNLDRLRYQMNRDIEDFKTRFSYLQERRFEPIINFYSAISELCSQASYIHTNVLWFPGEEVSSDSIEKLEELIQNAKKEYFHVRLFLPESIAYIAKSIIENISNAELDYHIELTGGSGEYGKAQKILKDRLTGSYDDELEELSQNIRFLLGVEDDEIMQKDTSE